MKDRNGPEPAHRSPIRRLALAAAAVFLAAGCASTPEFGTSLAEELNREQAAAETEKFLLDLIDTHNIPGLSIVVASADEIIYIDSFGEADAGTPFRANTLSNIGSVAKLFTGTAIMRLVEEGRVDLDAPVSAYVPEFQPRTWGPDPDRITIRSILAHQSGLPNDVLAMLAEGDRPYSEVPLDVNAGLAEVASNTTIAYEPYTVHSYSNFGINLLTLVVESAGGMSFNEYVRERVLAPVGMEDSSFFYRSELDERYARGIRDGEWVDIPGISEIAAGSMTSSAEEMGAFLRAVLSTKHNGAAVSEGGILEPETLERMWTRENANTPYDFDMVQMLSWYQVRANTQPEKGYYGHSGDLPPFHASVLVDPELPLGVFVMVNGGEGINSGDLSRLSIEVLRRFTLAEHAIELASGDRPQDYPVTSVPDETAERLIGDWISPLGLASIEQNAFGNLSLVIEGQPLRLDYRENDLFTLRYKLFGLFPISVSQLENETLALRDLNGEDIVALSSGRNLALTMTRAEPVTMHDAWFARTGTWRPTGSELDSDMFSFEFDLRNDQDSGLYLAVVNQTIGGMRQTIELPLASRNSDEAFTQGYGRNLGITLRAHEREGTEYLHWMGVEFVRQQ